VPRFLFNPEGGNMPAFTLTPAILAAIAGMVLSLFFSYIPGLNTWFAKQVEEIKKSIMLVLLLIVAVVVFVLQCFSILDAGLTCDRLGAIQLAWIFLSAVMANQSTFKITPQLKAVKAAKATIQLPKPLKYPRV
jgi:hypothetical protein